MPRTTKAFWVVLAILLFLLAGGGKFLSVVGVTSLTIKDAKFEGDYLVVTALMDEASNKFTLTLPSRRDINSTAWIEVSNPLTVTYEQLAYESYSSLDKREDLSFSYYKEKQLLGWKVSSKPYIYYIISNPSQRVKYSVSAGADSKTAIVSPEAEELKNKYIILPTSGIKIIMPGWLSLGVSSPSVLNKILVAGQKNYILDSKNELEDVLKCWNTEVAFSGTNMCSWFYDDALGGKIYAQDDVLNYIPDPTPPGFFGAVVNWNPSKYADPILRFPEDNSKLGAVQEVVFDKTTNNQLIFKHNPNTITGFITFYFPKQYVGAKIIEVRKGVVPVIEKVEPSTINIVYGKAVEVKATILNTGSDSGVVNVGVKTAENIRGTSVGVSIPAGGKATVSLWISSVDNINKYGCSEVIASSGFNTAQPFKFCASMSAVEKPGPPTPTPPPPTGPSSSQLIISGDRLVMSGVNVWNGEITATGLSDLGSFERGVGINIPLIGRVSILAEDKYNFGKFGGDWTAVTKDVDSDVISYKILFTTTVKGANPFDVVKDGKVIESSVLTHSETNIVVLLVVAGVILVVLSLLGLKVK